MKKLILYIVFFFIIVFFFVLLFYVHHHDKLIALKIDLQELFERNTYQVAKKDSVARSLTKKFEGLDMVMKIDSIRNFINYHTVHNQETERFKKNAFYPERVLKGILNTSNRKDTLGIMHLSCSPRAYAMRTILNACSIENRVIMLYFTGNGKIRSHTFLEVYNQQTKSWEVQDPDLNVYYVRKNDEEQEKLSLNDMKMSVEASDSIIPMNRGKNVSIWLDVNDKSIYGIHAQVFFGEAYKKNRFFIDDRYLDMSYQFIEHDNKTILEYFKTLEGSNLIIEW